MQCLLDLVVKKPTYWYSSFFHPFKFITLQFCTIPLDVAKVRLQLQKKAPPGEETPRYRGLLGCISTIAREEGLSALWHGLVPGLHRQCVYGGLRIGLYAPVSLK